MLATLGLIAGLGLSVAKPHPIDHVRLYRDLTGSQGDHISVWLDRSSPYRRGDRAKAYVSADRDGYLTVLRIDTDGRVRILFPEDPWDDNLVTGGRTFEVEDPDGDPSFRVDDAPGEGYVFAIVSDDRFDYSSIVTDRDHWDYRTIADGQVRGDPYVAVTDLAERIVPTGNYDYDLAQYDVDRHYDYPRFVCYDCHAFVPYYTWNPYGHNCVRFRVVIYDDPYYYPYRYYGGRRTVVVRPRRAEPRFVFVDNRSGDNYVTRIPTRPRREDLGNGGGDQMRPRRAEDVGGRGSIPAPGVPDRRIVRQGERRPDVGAQPQRGEVRPMGRDGDQPDARRPDRRPDDNTQPQVLRPQPRPPQAQPDQPRAGNEDRRGGSNPQLRPKPDNGSRDQPKPDHGNRGDPGGRPERRAEPARQPPRDQPHPRAEPQRQPERRQESPRSGKSGGSGPELRRRHG